MEVTGSVREELRESLRDVAWCVLTDGFARHIFHGRWIHSWEPRSLQMALGTDKVWHRCSVTFSLGHDIFAPLRLVLDVDNCCGHGLQDVLALTHVLPWWCGADSAQEDCWFISGNKSPNGMQLAVEHKQLVAPLGRRHPRQEVGH